MTESTIKLEKRGPISVITISRPDKRNAFNEQMWLEWEKIIEELHKLQPRAVVVTGAGEEAFSAGFDISMDNPQVAQLYEALQNNNPKPVEHLLNTMRRVMDNFVNLPFPIIAALNGLAYGGGAELAVRCDLRIADPKAIICFSEVRLGLMPDLGGGVALTRVVGPAIAADLILTARQVLAAEALSLGVINRISAPGSVLSEAIQYAESIAANGPRAVKSALEVIRRTPDMTYTDALALEKRRAIDLVTSGECFHGITAFLSRKKPEFPDA